MDNNRDKDVADGGGRTAYGSRRRHGNNADYDSAREVNNDTSGGGDCNRKYHLSNTLG